MRKHYIFITFPDDKLQFQDANCIYLCCSEKFDLNHNIRCSKIFLTNSKTKLLIIKPVEGLDFISFAIAIKLCKIMHIILF